MIARVDGREIGIRSPASRSSSAGRVAEVLFPDFGLPFEMYSTDACRPARTGARSGADRRRPGAQPLDADFCAPPPTGRGHGLHQESMKSKAAIREIHRIKTRDCVASRCHVRREAFPSTRRTSIRIWSNMPNCGLVLKPHVAISSTRTGGSEPTPKPPHPACLSPCSAAWWCSTCQQIVRSLNGAASWRVHPRSYA